MAAMGLTLYHGVYTRDSLWPKEIRFANEITLFDDIYTTWVSLWFCQKKSIHHWDLISLSWDKHNMVSSCLRQNKIHVYKWYLLLNSLSQNVHDMAFVVTAPKYSLRWTVRLRYRVYYDMDICRGFLKHLGLKMKKYFSKLIAWTYVVVLYHFVVRVQQ
jgi:hypothetical protein